MKIQEGMVDSGLDFRIGIHLGDVTDDGRDIHGEGVNIAARFEGLAEPGSINLSSSVYEQVRNRTATSFEDLGEHQVKHVSAKIHVFRVTHEETTPSQRTTPGLELSIPDKPSIDWVGPGLCKPIRGSASGNYAGPAGKSP